MIRIVICDDEKADRGRDKKAKCELSKETAEEKVKYYWE